MIEIIDRIIEKKEGNREFILTGDGQSEWLAAIGNQSKWISIGESLAYGSNEIDLCAEGKTAIEALQNLWSMMNA